MGACRFLHWSPKALNRPNWRIVSKLTTDVETYCTEASDQKSKYAYRKILFTKKALAKTHTRNLNLNKQSCQNCSQECVCAVIEHRTVLKSFPLITAQMSILKAGEVRMSSLGSLTALVVQQGRLFKVEQPKQKYNAFSPILVACFGGGVGGKEILRSCEMHCRRLDRLRWSKYRR